MSGQILKERELIKKSKKMTEVLINPANDFVGVQTQFIGNTNSIFKIESEIDLYGGLLELPPNSELKFTNGFFSNGKLKGDSTFIQNTQGKIFANDVEFDIDGLFIADQIYIEWFGAKGDAKEFDNIASITSGTNVLTVGQGVFSSQDVGKMISILFAGDTGRDKVLVTKIQTVNSAVEVALEDNALLTVQNTRIVYGTTNKDSFNQFNVFASTQIFGKVNMNFRGGDYIHEGSRWSFNIENLEVFGNGSKIFNLATNVWDRASLTTAANFKEETKDSELPGNASFYPIHSANTDDQSVVLKATSEVVEKVTFLNGVKKIEPDIKSIDVVVGKWYAVCSWGITYDGFPPNFRHIDYVKVTGFNGSTGEVDFEQKLKFSHKDDSMTVNMNGVSNEYRGEASIIPLELGSKWGIKHVYSDLRFKTETRDGTDPVRVSGRYVEFNNCEFSGLVPSVADTVVTKNCISKEAIEFDKNVLSFTDYNSSWEELSGGSSIHQARFVNSNLKSLVGFSPFNLEFENCMKTEGSFDIANRQGGIDTLRIDGGEYNVFPSHSILADQNPYVTVDGSKVLYKDGVLRILVTNESRGFLTQVYESDIIFVGGTIGNNELCLFDNNAKVVNVSSEELSNGSIFVNIDASFKNVLKEGDRVFVPLEPDSSSISGVFNGEYLEQDYLFRTKRIGLKNFSRIKTPLAFHHLSNPYGGVVKRITIDVKEAYSGAGNLKNFVLATKELDEFGSVVTKNICTIDLSVEGKREITNKYNFGFNDNSANDILILDVLGVEESDFVSQFFLRWNYDGDIIPEDNSEESAVIDLGIEFEDFR